MSHFTVLVVLPGDTADVDEAVGKAFAPFDENTETTPRKDYIEDWQEQYGRALKYYTDHPKDLTPGTDELDVAALLSDFNGTPVAEESLPDGTGVTYYKMTTYNPNSKWDWYQIGGRWHEYFPVKSEGVGDPRIVNGERSLVMIDQDPLKVPKPAYADGGPVGLLDLEFKRIESADTAGNEWDEWHAFAADYPPARPWSYYLGMFEDDIDRARSEYGAQPLVHAFREESSHRWLFEDPINRFSGDREDYVQTARDGAVPGYALLDLEGHWVAPGEMGWFGMSSDDDDTRSAYRKRVNEYIDALDPDTLVVLVDAHI